MKKIRDKYNILRMIMIAVMYLVVTYITKKFSFLDIQLRLTEALCILPVFTPVAIPALFIGCFFANLLSGAPLADVIFGSLATLLGACGTWKLRDKRPLCGKLEKTEQLRCTAGFQAGCKKKRR